MGWKDSWLQTNLPRRLYTDTEVNRTSSPKDETLGSGQHHGRNKKKWWIPKLRPKVKKMVNTCNVCKVFNTKPYGATARADMPQLTAWKPADFFLETTGVDFAGPIAFKITKKEQRKCYNLLFTCATSRAVHWGRPRRQRNFRES